MHANTSLDYKRHFIYFPGTVEPPYNGQVGAPMHDDLSAIRRCPLLRGFIIIMCRWFNGLYIQNEN